MLQLYNYPTLNVHSTFTCCPKVDFSTTTGRAQSVRSAEIEKKILPLLMRILCPIYWGMFSCLRKEFLVTVSFAKSALISAKVRSECSNSFRRWPWTFMIHSTQSQPLMIFFRRLWIFFLNTPKKIYF